MTYFNRRFIFLLLFLFFPFLSLAFTDNAVRQTPIRHLVVIFQENRSFDHYFGTYPFAENNPGEIRFRSKRKTPEINGLSDALRNQNQNAVPPFRLSPLFGASDVNNPAHRYTPLQQACNSGLMDKFVEFLGAGLNPPSVVMGHYDGNTVTALWNYAQLFSMSDNFRATNIGGSTAGAINLISGNTHGASPDIPDAVVSGILINDVDPSFELRRRSTEASSSVLGPAKWTSNPTARLRAG